VPEFRTQFFPGHNFTGSLQQDCQDVEGLFLKLDPHSLLVQLARAQVHLEHSESQNSGT
jgi:hypothetical protein